MKEGNEHRALYINPGHFTKGLLLSVQNENITFDVKRAEINSFALHMVDTFLVDQKCLQYKFLHADVKQSLLQRFISLFRKGHRSSLPLRRQSIHFAQIQLLELAYSLPLWTQIVTNFDTYWLCLPRNIRRGIPEILEPVKDNILPSKIEVSGGFANGEKRRLSHMGFNTCTNIRVIIRNEEDLTEFKQKFPPLSICKRLVKLEIMEFTTKLKPVKLTSKQRKSFTSGGIFQVYSEKGQSAAIENLCKEI